MPEAEAPGPQVPSGPCDALAGPLEGEPGPPDPGALDLAALRALRRDAQRQEADLSYLRRLLHGRIDILQAELGRRAHRAGAAGGPAAAPAAPESPSSPLVDRLPEILTDEPSPVRTSARHVTLGTPLTEPVRRLAEDMLAEVGLSDPAARTDAELTAAMARLRGHEHHISRRRQALQQTVDATSAEIARRYRSGEARVDDLLAGE
nr:hypothetical protein [Streptomyces sp. HPF1205]